MVAWKRNVFLGEREACREEFKKTRFLKYLIFGTDGIADIWGMENTDIKQMLRVILKKM